MAISSSPWAPSGTTTTAKPTPQRTSTKAWLHIVFNEYDTGDENTGFKLPSYPKYDIPIGFIDLAIDLAIDPASGQATVDLLNSDGHLGDTSLVNGNIQTFFNVEKRRHRFRLLDKGPSRFYQIYLTNPDNPVQSIHYWRISNNGNLYEKPRLTTNVKPAPAERADIIVDFNKLTAPGSAAAAATRLLLQTVWCKPSGANRSGQD